MTRDRVEWLLMYALSMVIDVLVLILMYVMEAGRGVLYCHPNPMQAIRDNARKHADENFPKGVRA